MVEATSSPSPPALIIREANPLNAGPPMDALVAADITPTNLFFIRSHGAVPAVDPAAWRLSVGGAVDASMTLSFGQLRQAFQRVEQTTTIVCAGNRRTELATVEPIPGELPWEAEAISTATWAGARLADVLATAGIGNDGPEGLHVCAVGADETERHGDRFSFGTSIPMAKALGTEVLLAYEMNGEPLAAEHGAPVRLLVPGYIGARSVKWVTAIEVTREPSTNYFQRVAYRLFEPGVRADTVDWAAGEMLGELPLNSAICEPADGNVLRPGRTTVRGYAIGSGARRVAAVELSTDGGMSWSPAQLLGTDRPWTWRRWEAAVDLATGTVDMAVRARDGSGATQPESLASVWNFKGYVNNAWHRIRVQVQPAG